ncbi:MAG: BatD family protein [Kiritimatiellae bacterium]|nr:BatD family protein [Kiritimatiellia bacterium]
MSPLFLIAAIKLVGVAGGELTTRAYFDVNNAKVGDPLVLTIDFVGDADFTALHPPALSKHVSKEDWKVDDLSAKTETDTKRIGGFFSSREVAVARSLTYRVRPMREGVLWFPALEFEYEGPDGEARTVTANEIPVHAKKGEQVVVKELSLDTEKMPEPPELAMEPGVALGDDELFAWRKACAAPSVDAFAEFQFPAGRMNEATCAIREGQWRRALKIYSRLEWSVGQTPGIERGILAARALKFDSAAAELPVWRVVGRPLLRYAWKGRVGILLGLALGVALLFWLLGRAIRALACVAFALLLVPAASGQGIFEEMERMMEQSRREMQQHMQQMQTMSFSVGGEQQKPIEIKASVRTEPAELQVGEPFAFILALESPKSASIGQIQIAPSEMFGLTVTGRTENLTDGVSSNPSNVVKRLSIPVRYDVPFKGKLSFRVSGMVSGRQRAGNMSFSFSNSFSVDAPPIDVDIKPLPSAGQPEDFSGIISEGMRLTERLDAKKVGTNDVIKITYHLECRGYLPKGWRPNGVAFEIGRGERNGTVAIEWMRYFVADGAAETPRLSVVYYDIKSKTYKKAETGGTHVEYE